MHLPPLITLLTDFGLRDSYVAQMKGVILGIAPSAQVVDLSHQVKPQDVAGAALLLDDALDAFPVHAIHVVVVDPGVGSTRRAIALSTARGRFIGPDNGVFSAVLARTPLEQAVELRHPAYQRQPVSSTFHGRDLFAPAAGHLARGVAMTELGPAATNLVNLSLPTPTVTPTGLTLHVLAVDHFGNLLTDLRSRHTAGRSFNLLTDDDQLIPLVSTFADLPEGALLAYWGSTDRLEIACRNGSAAQRLAAGVGTVLSLCWR